jgi:uncharacterized protein (DUF885 family)
VSIQQELEGVPRFRRFGGDYTAYVEGWALYAESLGRELGLFTDPYQWYGRLNDEQLRAMRLVVDTGLHAKGWTREQAIKFMLDNSTMAESDVVSEVERYIAWPGQALGYKVGDLRIQGLRHKAEQALGPQFDLRDFHREVLSDGACRWTCSQRRSTAGSRLTAEVATNAARPFHAAVAGRHAGLDGVRFRAGGDDASRGKAFGIVCSIARVKR